MSLSLIDFVSTWGLLIIEQRVEGGCQNSGAYHAARRRQVRVRCTRFFENEAGPTESGFAWKSAKIPQDAGPGEKGAIARNWLNRKEQDLARAAAAREYGLKAAPAKANRGLRGF